MSLASGLDMGVMLNLNWRMLDGTTDKVGWPTPGPTQLSAYRRIAAAAADYRAAGFSAILLPPSTRGGAGAFSDGYDLFDNYDIDGTAFGSGEELRRCIAAIHVHGMQAYGDLVLHQMGGGTAAGVYAYQGSSGPGRFPKTASCFVGAPPRVAVDQVPDSTGNFAFGDLVSYQNSQPPGTMWQGGLAAATWLQNTLGLDGWRIDDVKGTNAAFVHAVLTQPAFSGLYAFGEYFDGNPDRVGRWVNQLMGRRAGVLDFAFKFNVGNICNNNSRVWMGQLADIGWCTKDAATAVTFVESADTDTSPGEQTIWNKLLGYALMLTFPGYPQVYYRDYATDPGCYGLRPAIDNLIWIHENLAQGDFVVRLDDDPQVFVHERTGYGSAPGCLCAFNNDQFQEYTRTVQTHFGNNQRLHEYTGNGGYYNDLWTDNDGRLSFTLPRNYNGCGYLVFSLPGKGSSAFSVIARQTSQQFDGAADLKISPIPRSGTIEVGRVYARAGTDLSVTLQPDQTGWGNDVQVSVSCTYPGGKSGCSLDFDDQGSEAQGFTRKAPETGYYAISIVSRSPDLPEKGSPFELRCDYTGA